MESRGKKLLGLTKLKKRSPLKNLNLNILPRPFFNSAMEKCQRFLNVVRTPSEMRDMNDVELADLRSHYSDEQDRLIISIPAELAQHGDDALEPGTEEDLLLDIDTRQRKTASPRLTNDLRNRTVRFGDLGFMNMGGNDDDTNDVGDDNETEDVDENTGMVEVNGNEMDVVSGTSGQMTNETTPACHDKTNRHVDGRRDTEGLKRRREDVSSHVKRKSKRKSPKEVRIDLKGLINSNDKQEKTKKASKKGFKNNFLTIKFKLSGMQVKNGAVPDFALFVKDDLHENDVQNPSKHAGKYLSFVKGKIGDSFFSKQGISYKPEEYFMCENGIDLAEDKITPHLKTRSVPAEAIIAKPTVAIIAKPTIAKPADVSNVLIQDTSEDESGSGEDVRDVEDKSDSDDVESTLDLFNMRDVARRVSWGPPPRENSGSSRSSGGALVYGRGAEKVVSKEKKKKGAEEKKHSKASSNRTKSDILEGKGSKEWKYTGGE